MASPDFIALAARSAFGIIQALTLIFLIGGFKFYMDHMRVKRDLNEAFRRLRRLENGKNDGDCNKPDS